MLNWLPFIDSDLGGLTPAARFRRALAAVDELIYAEIADRRAALGTSATTCCRSCCGPGTRTAAPMTDVELRDELLTLLTAGHETTATGLSWAFERLLRTPRVLERLESLDDDEYLDAVVKETLRVRPVVVDVARKLTRETEVAGYTLPAGTLVLPRSRRCTRARTSTRARRVPPERFIDGQPESYAWIPFGGGVRRCIGASFAQVEMRVVLREVLRRVRLGSLARPERPRIQHVTVVPAPRRARRGDRAAEPAGRGGAGRRARLGPSAGHLRTGLWGRRRWSGAGMAAGSPAPPCCARQTLLSSLCMYQRPTGEIRNSRMKITGPLAGRPCRPSPGSAGSARWWSTR